LRISARFWTWPKAPREDPGARPLLQRYARARHADILARVTGIDALNRASMVEAQGLRDMRMRALDAIYRVAPVRRVLMQTGLGARG
jgi:2-octaprenyl-6-methoxyphenol hydroxylase